MMNQRRCVLLILLAFCVFILYKGAYLIPTAPYTTFIAPEFITDSTKDSERIDELLQEDHNELKRGNEPLLPGIRQAVVSTDEQEATAGSLNTHHRISESSDNTTDNEFPPDKMGKQHGYIVTLGFSGQQASAMQALVSQLCWVGSFGLPMYVVEPFIRNNTVGCILNRGESRFSEYFDLHKFSEASTREGYAELASWDDFVKNAPRRTILIRMDGINSTGIRSPTQVVHTARKRTNGCYVLPLTYPTYPTTFPYFSELMEDFCITEVINAPFDFFSYKIFTAEEMYNVIFKKWKPEEVTLVISLWRGPWYVPNPKLENPHSCRHSRGKRLRDRFYPSLQLLKHAEKYESTFLKPRNSLAVMMRMEHVVYQILKLKKGKGLSPDVCLQKLTDTVKSIRKRFFTSKAFVTADIGSYKSASWDKLLPMYSASSNETQLMETVKRTVCALSNHEWTFDEWEKSFVQATDGMDSPAYIAALQRTIASRADCLVLLGGGDFQKLALETYIQNHPDKSKWCIHQVCTHNEQGLKDVINGMEY